ncbi:NmrA family NAD(P)-binding protein [Subtercola lobariae]|uniref:Epimerase n=1 Tax=Subtercola lobariae TaxID=1588641 RepID=A0A917BCH5_9MICO|nr:NmrA family NAD(P)-binding protein [Subtercola lobariae]GGF31799.1 epimerase [Subtercola lobariae]
MLLITSANGNQGKLLVPKLLAAGASLRCVVRSESSAESLRELGVEQVLVDELFDEETLKTALDGIDGVYYLNPTGHPAEREVGLAIVEAAVRANVDHFVFSSVLHSISTGLFQHQYKRDVEERLVASGLKYTILQPANYMTAFELLPAFRDGVYQQAWSLERRMSMVDLDDVTDVAAEVLTHGAEHWGATYELCSAGWLTAQDVADAVALVVGDPVAVREITPEEWAKMWFGDVDLELIPDEGRVLRQICAFYSDHDHVGSPNVLRWLLKREPSSIEDFARKVFPAFRDGQVLERAS